MENYCLTFRLTRNCGWNRCLFCPAYKYGAQLSRRDIDEIKRDVDRARLINYLLIEYDIGGGFTARSGSQEIATLIREIQAVHVGANKRGGVMP